MHYIGRLLKSVNPPVDNPNHSELVETFSCDKSAKEKKIDKRNKTKSKDDKSYYIILNYKFMYFQYWQISPREPCGDLKDIWYLMLKYANNWK